MDCGSPDFVQNYRPALACLGAGVLGCFPPALLTELRPVAQWSEPAPYKGQTTVRLRPGLLRQKEMGLRC